MAESYPHNNRGQVSNSARNRRACPPRDTQAQGYSRSQYGSSRQAPSGQTPPPLRAAQPRSHYNARQEAAKAGSGSRTAPPSSRSKRAPYGRPHYEPYVAQEARRTPKNGQNEASAYLDRNRYRNRKPQKKRFSFVKLLATLAVAALCAFGLWGFVQAQPINVTVNGVEQQLGGAKNLSAVLEEGFAKPLPGNFIAVDGSLIEEGKGQPFSATINKEASMDANTHLANGDSIEITDGADITEEATTADKTIPIEVVEQGTGAIHRVTQPGQEGVSSTMTGKVSGKTVTKDTTEMQPRIYEKYAVDTQGDKVICLTFDDGPWPGSTENILDVLKKYDAKATFFVLGERIVDQGTTLVKRQSDEGHQVCTHSFDHARGSGQGVNMSFMTPEEQIAEVTKGQEAISGATGKEASKVFRAPGGNFPLSVWQNVESLITAEIGWNIDSGDWRRPGAEVVASSLTSAAPGDVFLCHDGGGDRSQTLEALKQALPVLKEKGYRFITIDELLKYPAKPAA
ncbi:MAG: polysaccharide deacetylase family protein [Raoultibacter sp.]